MFKVHIFRIQACPFLHDESLTEPYVSEKRHRMDEQRLEPQATLFGPDF